MNKTDTCFTLLVNEITTNHTSIRVSGVLFDSSSMVKTLAFSSFIVSLLPLMCFLVWPSCSLLIPVSSMPILFFFVSLFDQTKVKIIFISFRFAYCLKNSNVSTQFYGHIFGAVLWTQNIRPTGLLDLSCCMNTSQRARTIYFRFLKCGANRIADLVSSKDIF